MISDYVSQAAPNVLTPKICASGKYIVQNGPRTKRFIHGSWDKTIILPSVDTKLWNYNFRLSLPAIFVYLFYVTGDTMGSNLFHM